MSAILSLGFLLIYLPSSYLITLGIEKSDYPYFSNFDYEIESNIKLYNHSLIILDKENKLDTCTILVSHNEKEYIELQKSDTIEIKNIKYKQKSMDLGFYLNPEITIYFEDKEIIFEFKKDDSDLSLKERLNKLKNCEIIKY